MSKCSQVFPKTPKKVVVQQRSFRQLIEFPRLSGAPGEIRTPDPLLRRQTLYPTELRAHPWLLFDSTALATLIRVPTLRRFLEHLEQVRQIRRPRSLLPED